MIARASRVLPGVLVTMLFAGTAFAAPAPDDSTTASHASHAKPHHQAAAAAHAKKPAETAKTASVKKPESVKKPDSVKTASAKPVRHHTAAPSAQVQTAAFIDDGFSYTEGVNGESGWKQSGVASWYGGKRWQGNRTSSGARYDENELTAAHATLPLGSHIRVSLNNSAKSVVVTITDRPGTRSRIIDLSKGAAKALGILNQGVAMVTLSPVRL